MATVTMAVRSCNIRQLVYGFIGLLLLAGALVGFLLVPADSTVSRADDLGAWERSYFLEGNRAPVFVDTGVNASIAQLAAFNAAVAATVRPGDDVIGNSERLMFGLD